MPRRVDLQPLSQTEFEKYVDTVTAGYAVELAESVGLSPEDAKNAAEAHIAQTPTVRHISGARSTRTSTRISRDPSPPA